MNVFERFFSALCMLFGDIKRSRVGASPVSIVIGLIGVVVGIYVFALMFPDAVNTLFNITWGASVPTGVQTLSTTLVAIIGAIVFILLLLKQTE